MSPIIRQCRTGKVAAGADSRLHFSRLSSPFPQISPGLPTLTWSFVSPLRQLQLQLQRICTMATRRIRGTRRMRSRTFRSNRAVILPGLILDLFRDKPQTLTVRDEPRPSESPSAWLSVLGKKQKWEKRISRWSNKKDDGGALNLALPSVPARHGPFVQTAGDCLLLPSPFLSLFHLPWQRRPRDSANGRKWGQNHRIAGRADGLIGRSTYPPHGGGVWTCLYSENNRVHFAFQPVSRRLSPGLPRGRTRGFPPVHHT